MQTNDSWMIILLLLIAVVWVYFLLKHQGKRVLYYSAPRHNEVIVPSDDAVEIMQDAGYEWIAGKVKLPIMITLDETEQLHSRLFADGFVEKGQEWFVVKFTRERKPIEMTGSAIREQLLVYSLIYPQASGVLLVDLKHHTIRKIQFEIEL